YLIITPNEGSCRPNATVTFVTIRDGALESRAAIIPCSAITAASLDVAIVPSNAENLGLAVVNPSPSVNAITLTLRDSDGATVGRPAVVPLQPWQQMARFTTEFFTSTATTSFRGVLRVQAPAPVSILGLRF